MTVSVYDTGRSPPSSIFFRSPCGREEGSGSTHNNQGRKWSSLRPLAATPSGRSGQDKFGRDRFLEAIDQPNTSTLSSFLPHRSTTSPRITFSYASQTPCRAWLFTKEHSWALPRTTRLSFPSLYFVIRSMSERIVPN